jgi:hypothetical protein
VISPLDAPSSRLRANSITPGVELVFRERRTERKQSSRLAYQGWFELAVAAAGGGVSEGSTAPETSPGPASSWARYSK